MAAKERDGSQRGTLRRGGDQPNRIIGPAVHEAINRGFVVGREVLIGTIPALWWATTSPASVGSSATSIRWWCALPWA
jgi:hypothetical protein